MGTVARLSTPGLRALCLKSLCVGVHTPNPTRRAATRTGMAYKAKKTEHTGAQHGNGVCWGTKEEAKQESSKRRRRAWRPQLREDRDEVPLILFNASDIFLSKRD